MTSFIERQFPCGISEGAVSSPERRTDIVMNGGGYEERNSRWAQSRRHYDAAFGVKTLDDLHEVIDMWEEMRGRLIGFRWKDYTDFKSSKPSVDISATDQVLAIGDGIQQSFRLIKTYGVTNKWTRYITKPVANTVRIAVNGIVQTITPTLVAGGVTVDPTSGIVVFWNAPAIGAVITAGYEFDVPARFDTDTLPLSVTGVKHGEIQNITIVELRLKLVPLPPNVARPGFILQENGSYLLQEENSRLLTDVV